MMDFLAWVENTGFAIWVRESPSLLAYTLFLSLHTIGLAFLVGFNAVIDLRILGVAPRLPLAPMAKFFPIMYLGFWVNALTGVVLLSTAPISFLTNPVFYIKLMAIALAVVTLRRLRSQVFGDLASLDTRPVPMNGKILAGTSLAFWPVAIIAGRLTAYSRPVVLATVGACLTLATVVLAAGYIARLLRWRVLSRQGV